MKRWLSLLLALALCLGLTACGGSEAEPDDTDDVPAQEEPETEPEPAPEPEPEPEPIIIPDPVTYTGSGDDVIEITPLDGPWMMHITGNSAGRHFAVTGYDNANEYVDGLVNTTDPYDGYVFDDTQSTTLLEVKAEGDWTVELVSVYTAETVSVDAPLSGTGDSVLSLTIPDSLWAFHISGNSDSRHFAVRGYDSSFNFTDTFVNTTEVYDGVTIDPSQSTALLSIVSESDWTIEPVYARDLQEANEEDTITGTGDMVIMTDTVGQTAAISGNAGGHHFAVRSLSYTNSDLLVNTTDPYEGTVMLSFDPTLIVVTAEGDWSITF